MDILDVPREAAETLLMIVGNGFAWLSHTEQIWFPTIGAYVRFVAPEAAALPDLRGPFLMLSILYIGFRLGDLLDERDELNT